ncbi:inositol monophosphatase family protein [Pseudoruegeria sp. SK021]|uniref:inositol monophosphatase family protein n=1 Tax=Pseudoruegeria sp. SK021 TaxID=1933035 RepID=UPI000A2474CF|nr:inositol monophosphatase family protein [Pseudoruegeria sp. SK021]OSP55231.1 histidinol-phosphatase [Pseudoruegeria sp. SK021]
MTEQDVQAQSLRRTAYRLADVARRISLEYFRNPALVADNKAVGGFDPVTQADRACELAMREVLAADRPDDAIEGEEFGPKSGTSGLRWVLDPIDGTRGFLSGTPTWGVLIAVCDDTGPIFGVIDQPYIGERFEGGFGGARLSRGAVETPLRTRNTQNLADAILFSTFPEVGTKDEGAAFATVARAVKLTRYGMDCYAYGLMALGQIDLVIEAGLQPYDVLAPIAVVEAAGGIVTDWQGRPAHGGGRVLAAANPAIHTQALAMLSTCPEAAA